MTAGLCFRIGATLGVLAVAGLASPALAADRSEQGELLDKENRVESAAPQSNWIPAEPGLKLRVQDRLRTLALSRATLRLAELGRLRVNELTTLEILPPRAASNKAVIDLKAGAVYFLTREKPREFLLQTPYAIGASRGTEFLAEVGPNGRTVVTVFDGELELTNDLGAIVLTNNDQGTVEPGQPPVKTAVIQATNIVQWWLYYPGVLDPDDLAFTPAERTLLSASISAYRDGDLKQALQAYPTGRVPQSEAERIYYAGLLLSVGQVDKAEALLSSVRADSPLEIALRQVIDVVSGRGTRPNPSPASATEWMAMSYVYQPTNLPAALQSARAAAAKSPSFGFTWERVGELEFSFGHIRAAKQALESALRLSPRNAQALALRGFLLTAENNPGAARPAFEQAIQADGALGNAWLGRGLCRIFTRDNGGGLGDLETAAALEPNRSLLRSYLGKGFNQVYDNRHAEKELTLAKTLDQFDPTPFLYSALLNQQENRLNQGVDDLEQSLQRNDNRHVYRSQLLLDEDRAVRSASLASIYNRDGMEFVAAREAASAVSSDYGNYSAHLFLANSLDALRDPTLYNLRYETAWLNELLLANLLAPAGAGPLSPSITQQEYSRLFEANGPGLVSDTSYRSDGQFYESGSQFGTFGNTSYSIDAEYRRNAGVRPNNSLEYWDGTVTLKQQLTPLDSVQAQVALQNYRSGDNFQYYNPRVSAQTNYHYRQQQTPTVVLGYHREWSPGVHTLILGTRLSADQQFNDKTGDLLLFIPANVPGGTNSLNPFPFGVKYHNSLVVYGGELNQIFQSERSTLVAGVRAQAGTFKAKDNVLPTNPAFDPFFFPPDHEVEEGFQRTAGYGYYTLQLPYHFLVTGGLAYDTITYPLNFQSLPVSSGRTTRSEVEPKAALIWTPVPEATVRGAYARSMGGVSIDQSFRLEPVQLAGFNQTFRNIMPVIPASDVSAPTFDMYGLALDLKFKSRTYIGIQGELLQSTAGETIGLYEFNGTLNYPASSTLRRFDYKEASLTVTLNQLVGDYWSLGALYQVTRSELDTAFPEISAPATFPVFDNDLHVRAILHQVTPYILFNHPSGFFARAEVPWYSQSNSGYTHPLAGDDFYQVNLFAGYRFPRQYGDFTFGLLNLTGQNYHLNPLNPYEERPREFVWSVELRLNF